MSTPAPSAALAPARGLNAYIQRWFWARIPRRDSTALVQRNLYILPTGAGLLLAVTLLALLIGSINYQLNLGYLLTFLIAGCAVISVPMTHNNLRGLRLHLRAPQPQYAGRPVLLDVHIHNPSKRVRSGVGLWVQDGTVATQKQPTILWHDCPAQAEQSAQLAWHWAQRGWHDLPPIQIETRFPLGVFRVWSVWRTASQVLLYPSPEANPPPLPLVGGSQPHDDVPAAPPAAASRSDDVPDEIRPYQRGDSPRHIAWRKVAQTGEMLTRESRRPDSRTLWLALEAAAPQRGTELALQRLCAWVLVATAQNQRFGLHLPPLTSHAAVRIAPDQGEAHSQRCLQALAEWGLTRPAQVVESGSGAERTGRKGFAQGAGNA